MIALPPFTGQGWQLVVLVGAGATTISIVWKKAVKPLLHGCKQVWKFAKSIESKFLLIDAIADSVKPNGGSSLRDAVDRIEFEVGRVFNRQRALLDLYIEPFFEVDVHGDYTLVNRAWTDLTGLPISRALGSGWVNAVHPEDREWVRREWDAAMEEGRIFSSTMRFVSLQGQIYSVMVQTAPFLDKTGLPIGHMGTVRLMNRDRDGETLLRHREPRLLNAGQRDG